MQRLCRLITCRLLALLATLQRTEALTAGALQRVGDKLIVVRVVALHLVVVGVNDGGRQLATDLIVARKEDKVGQQWHAHAASAQRWQGPQRTAKTEHQGHLLLAASKPNQFCGTEPASA